MSGDTVRPVAGVEIELVPWLTDFLDGRRSGRAKWSEGVVQGESVRSLLARLHRSHPRLAEAVYSLEESRLTGLVNVLLNERALELAGGLDAPLCDGDRLTLVPAYCGGEDQADIASYPKAGRKEGKKWWMFRNSRQSWPLVVECS